jgi:hypothetical protein
MNFKNLQNIYNNQMDMLLSSDGLTTNCTLVFGISKKNICINCIYDPQLKKSTNKYKIGGPVPFPDNRICPYCSGSGFYGQEILEENVFLAVIWDSKKWLGINTNIKSPEDYIQTISNSNILNKIQSCNYIVVKNQKFQIEGKPSYSGLGDNNYIICLWKKIS